jgi:hypothetical protein
MIWADRLAALLAALWFPVIFITLGGFAPDRYIRQEYAENWLLLFGVPVVAVWFLLRIIDTLAAGPARRRGRISARVVR